MKKARQILAVLTLFAALVLAGCSSVSGVGEYRDHRNPDPKLTEGLYAEAMEIVEAKVPLYEEEKNAISYRLDKGLLNHYAGEYQASTRELEECNILIEEAFTQSISDNFKALLSDKPKNSQYRGEDYENIYLQVFNSLNYYHLGNYESAMVEIRQMNEKLQYMSNEYENQSARLSKKTTKKKSWLYMELIGRYRGETAEPVVPPREIHFTNSALARYLGVLYHRANGNLDGARIDSEEITNAFAEFRNVYNFPIPRELVLRDGLSEETNIPQGKARLNVLSFTGLSDLKTPRWIEERFEYHYYGRTGQSELRPPYDPVPIRMAVESRQSSVERITVTVEGAQGSFTLSRIENLQAVIGILNERMLQRMATIAGVKMAADMAFRLAGGAAPLILGTAVKETFGKDYYRDLGPKPDDPDYEEKLTQHIWAGLQAQSRHLDTRMGRFFPGMAYCGGITLDPGIYTITINYYSETGLVKSDRRENVQVTERGLNLIESVCLDTSGTIAEWARGTYANGLVVGSNTITNGRDINLTNVRTVIGERLADQPGLRWALIYVGDQKYGVVYDRASKVTHHIIGDNIPTTRPSTESGIELGMGSSARSVFGFLDEYYRKDSIFWGIPEEAPNVRAVKEAE